MTLIRVASLSGVSLMFMAANVAASFLYMVIYGYLINPGHPKAFYDEHIKVAAPYCSIVAGFPLMFLAAFWVAGWAGGQFAVKSALIVWLAYAVIDVAIVLAAGAMTPKLAVLVTVSLLTKLGAAYAGALVRGASPAVPIVPG